MRILLTLILILWQTVLLANDSSASNKKDAIKRTIEEKVRGKLVKERLLKEFKAYDNTFALIPHKRNFLLPLTFQDNPNSEPFKQSNHSVMKTEVKFQVSFKVPVAKETVFKDNGYLFFGYSSKSVWQAYNTNESSPFRDTNHEPEVMLSFLTDYNFLGAHVPLITIGASHQSNGRSEHFSRSWNRIYAEILMEYDDFYFSFKPWWRIPERAKRNAQDTKGDDNPDIDDYYGYFELRSYKRIGDNELSIMLRNNLRSDNKGAIELNYSYPFTPKAKGYVQLFHGYGETLLDYNHKNTRLGIGIMLNNWL